MSCKTVVVFAVLTITLCVSVSIAQISGYANYPPVNEDDLNPLTINWNDVHYLVRKNLIEVDQLKAEHEEIYQELQKCYGLEKCLGQFNLGNVNVDSNRVDLGAGSLLGELQRERERLHGQTVKLEAEMREKIRQLEWQKQQQYEQHVKVTQQQLGTSQVYQYGVTEQNQGGTTRIDSGRSEEVDQRYGGGYQTQGGSQTQGGYQTQGGSQTQGGYQTQGGSQTQGGYQTQGGSQTQGGYQTQGGSSYQSGTDYRSQGGSSYQTQGGVNYQGGSSGRTYQYQGNSGDTRESNPGSYSRTYSYEYSSNNFGQPAIKTTGSQTQSYNYERSFSSGQSYPYGRDLDNRIITEEDGPDPRRG